ncbi:hypothetical protein [Thiomicrospira sp.]|uniref:hypothetical protein n=1 Tax=Thiomicrospira sp. TaxID=935 RepID=UPI002F93156E
MSMTKLGNLVFSSGKTGNKNHWVKSGALYQRPDGSFAVKLDQLPIGFDGWFSVFPEENQANHQPQYNQAQQGYQQFQSAQQPASIESLSAEQIRQLLLQRLQQ